MLKNRYAILIAAAILGTSLCAGRVLAQEGPPPGGMMGGPPGGMMGGPPPVPPPLMMALRAANLTDDQKKQVHDHHGFEPNDHRAADESDALDS